MSDPKGAGESSSWTLFHTVKPPQEEDVSKAIDLLLKSCDLKRTAVQSLTLFKSSQNFTYAVHLAPEKPEAVSDSNLEENKSPTHFCRVTPQVHQSPKEIEAELQYLKQLGGEGVSVCEAVGARAQSFTSQDRIYQAVLFRSARGVSPMAGSNPWKWVHNKPLHRAWGKQLALMHQAYEKDAKNPLWDERPLWNQVHSNLLLHWKRVLLHPQDEDKKLFEECKQVFGKIDKIAQTCPFGLIHGDLNCSNFFVFQKDPDEIALDVFDHDQVQRGWFVYDIAIVLWGIRVVGYFMEEKVDLESFDKEVIAGYESIRPLHSEERSYLPLFIQVRKLFYILYAVKTIRDLKIYPDMVVPKGAMPMFYKILENYGHPLAANPSK